MFDLMTVVLGGDFRSDRIRAEDEARAENPQLSLDDIYDRLQVARAWTAEERQRAKELEIETEFENAIPISENLGRVKDGDVLVSDMYLPHDTILRLLQSVGLERKVTLYVSANGKSDGSMWRLLKRKYFILKHVGDNPRTDFLVPIRHFIPAGLTDSSSETSWERLLRCNGAPALSSYVREMRLRGSKGNSDDRALRAAQIEANFPLLLFSSAALVRWCGERGISRALMASRDCVLWAPLAERVALQSGTSLSVEYFLISRVAALRSSGEYLKYAGKRLTRESVVVDLSMTGVSLAGLAERLGIEKANGFVIAWHRSLGKSLYGERFQPKSQVSVDFLFAEIAHNDLEALNQASTPSVHDVVETDGGLSVTYASENRSPAVLKAVDVQNAVFFEMLSGLPDAVVSEALEIANGNRLVFFVRECERHAGSFQTVITRAKPGAALWNDPNAIKLNLPYANVGVVPRWMANPLKRVLRPLMRPGSFLNRYGTIPGMVLRALKRRKS